MSSLSEILFPSQEANTGASNINRILGDLKRSTLSITNRLKSIQQDADFVDEVAASFGGKRPLVANERCGSWYIRPECKGGSAYFKSTDGHTGQWKFSTRRLNLHLLPIIEKCDGIIVVDSTRRGKRMPDALSKTVPIWCCVLNRALFPDHPDFHDLYVPPNAVSDSEHSQMLSRIPEGLDALKQLNIDLAGLRAQVSRPLRPTWVTQETTTGDLSHYHAPHHHHHHHHHQQSDEEEEEEEKEEEEEDRGKEKDTPPHEIFESFRPVICCTASKRVVDGEMSGHTGYIQGAGDDTENWAHGLTAPIFWAHADRLLSTPEADLPDLIRRLTAAAATEAPASDQPVPRDDNTVTATNGTGTGTGTGSGSSTNPADLLPPTVRQLTSHLYVSPMPIPQRLPTQVGAESSAIRWCTIALLSTTSPPETWLKSPVHMEVGLGKHKAASRNLRVALTNICGFVSRFLNNKPDADKDTDKNADKNREQRQEHKVQKRVLVACETGGKDLSVGVALALLCWCFEDEGGRSVREMDENSSGESAAESMSFNKTMIKIRLGRIMMAMPDANPNRATLQSVNSFLMDWRK